jgi:hypothetical protein
VDALIASELSVQETIDKELTTLLYLPIVKQLVDFEKSTLNASLNEVPQHALPLSGDVPIDNIHDVVGAKYFHKLNDFELKQIFKKFNLLFGLGIANNRHLLERFEGPPTKEFAHRWNISSDPTVPTPKPQMPSLMVVRTKVDAVLYLADFMCLAVPGETPYED